MDNGKDKSLYTRFSRVAQKIGVYTARDYADIIDDLVTEWKVAGLGGLTDVAAKGQDYLCGLAERYRKLAERVKFSGGEKFSWIYDREIALAPAAAEPE